MMKLLVVSLSAMLSLLLPWALIMVRQSVKKQRQDVIRDLEAVFHPEGGGGNEEQIIPSFEFVKFKYFVNQDDEKASKKSTSRPERHPKDFPYWILIISSAPLSIMLFVFGLIAFGAIFVIAREDIVSVLSQSFGNELLSDGPDKLVVDSLKRWDLMAVFIVAYLATYLYIIRDHCEQSLISISGPTTLLASANSRAFWGDYCDYHCGNCGRGPRSTRDATRDDRRRCRHPGCSLRGRFYPRVGAAHTLARHPACVFQA